MREHLPASLRYLLRSRSFALLATAILALGIASVTAMWTVVSQVVLRPLPVQDQDRIVVAWTRERVRGVEHFPWTGEMFEAVEGGGVPAFTRVAAVGSWGTGEVVVEDADGPRTLLWAHTLGDYFGVLGVEPQVGRLLRLEDDITGPAERVAVISDALWASRWGRSPDAIGSGLATGFGTFTVIGVTPREFDYPLGTQLWVPERPFHPDWGTEVPHLELDFVARLAPGATAAQAAEQLGGLAPTPELARTYANAEPVVRPLAQVVLGEMRPTVLVLFAGAVLVLLVAVLDVANLVLLRSIGRRQEVAIRRALGADSGHLTKQALKEAAWLGGGAAVAGAALAWAALSLLLPFAPEGLPRLSEVHGLDGTAYLFSLGGSACAVLAAVLLPLWRAERIDPLAALRGAGRGSDPSVPARTRSVLVSGQVALTVWVVMVGALMTRSVLSLRGLDLGFRPDGLVAVALDYADPSLEGRPGWVDRLESAMEEMRRDPGVVGVTPLQMAPLPGNAAWQSIAFREGETKEEGEVRNSFMMWELVEPDVFEVLGVPVLRGRGFRETDDDTAPPVVVVNQAAARLYWPGQEALGQRLWVPWGGGPEQLWAIVGVVADTRYGALTELRPAIYYPLRQTRSFRSNYLVVRTSGEGQPVMRIARDALEMHAPDFRPKSAVSVRGLLDGPLARPRFAAILISAFATVALLLSATGLFGIMAFLVRSRRRETGIRLACGSTPLSAAGRVLLHGVLVASAGAAVGAVSSVASGAAFRALLFGVAPWDPLSVGVSVGVAIIVAVVACGVPARQAASVDPAVVLRDQ
jgi:predicted permease